MIAIKPSPPYDARIFAMTPDDYIAHVDESIAKALRHESYIDVEILSCTGFSTGVMRRLISNLAHLPIDEPVYAEAGLYAGASVCAAMNNNPTAHIYGIENFSQDFGNPTIREQLERNIERFRGGAKSVTIINTDFFSLDLSLIEHPVSCYYYDAHHNREYQAKALPFFLPALADTFIWIVDDNNWDSVRLGSADGIRECGNEIRVEKQWNLSGEKLQDDPIFWNGMAIYVISKQ